MSEATTIEIKNNGAIENLTIPVPEKGGVVVMHGRNGTGKTTALQAVESMIGGKGSLALRDGEKKGSVEGFGVAITIGRSTRRKGEAEVLSLDGKFSIIDLVEPGVKSPEAADAKRIKALIGISAVEASDSALYDAVGGVEAYESIASSTTIAEQDIVAKTEKFKRDIERKAREWEDEAKKHRGAAAALTITGDIPEMVVDAEARLEKAIIEHSRLETRKSEREQALAEKAELVKGLAQLRESAEAYDLTKLFQKKEICMGQLDAHARAVELARAELKRKEAEFDEIDKELHRIELSIDTAQKHEAKVQEFEAALEQSTPEPVADEELAEAKSAIAVARQQVIDKETHMQLIGQAVERDKHIKKIEECDSCALHLRECAQSLDEVLSGLVGDGPLRVEDGRLVTTTGRGTTYFSELSWGERWRMALEIAVKVVGDGGWIVVPQEAYEGLDPVNRAELREIAEDVGVVIFTAMADDGPLRAEAL